MANASLRDKLRRLEALMQCDLAEVIDAVVTEKLESLEATCFGKAKSPRATLEEDASRSLCSRTLSRTSCRTTAMRLPCGVRLLGRIRLTKAGEISW